MKTYKYITLAAMALTFTACSQDENFLPQETDSDAVRINATIDTMPQTRLAYGDEDDNFEEATTFTEGDKIRVQNTNRTTKNIATYTYDGSSWSTTDFLVWNGSLFNRFEAWYPVADYSSFSTFELPTDQSSDALLAAADWMTASTVEMTKTSDGTINLAFRHLLTMVTIRVNTWGTEYPVENRSISDVKIYTIATGIGKDSEGKAVNNDISPIGITPLHKKVSGIDSYTAIVCPYVYVSDDRVMTLTVNNQDDLQVLAHGNRALMYNGLQPGKHYTFELKVGQDYAEINSVSVEEWGTTDNIDGGVAEETE